jgi:hypothetical protein
MYGAIIGRIALSILTVLIRLSSLNVNILMLKLTVLKYLKSFFLKFHTADALKL